MAQKILLTIILLSFLLCGTASAYVSDEFETLEEAEEWAEKIGMEYYEDPDYFNFYDETFDVFYNESNGVYLDFIEGEWISEGIGEVLLSRGYTYSDGIWIDGDGFYYEDSWEYMSWDEAQALYEEYGVDYCGECENIIEDRYSDHDEDCPNNPNRESGKGKVETREEESFEEPVLEYIIVSLVLAFPFLLCIICHIRDKIKIRKYGHL